MTSGLGEVHLDEEKNVGFALRYRMSARGMIRRNTRTLGNEEAASEREAATNEAADDQKATREGDAEEDKKENPTASKEEKRETKILAFKALPPQASASKGLVEDRTADLSETELVTHVCAEIYKTMASLRIKEGEKQEDLPGIEEKAVISAAEARRATGYMESIGYGLKRMVWS